jgi:hypothetical protein
MLDQASGSSGGGTPFRGEGSARVDALMARAQRLVDAPRPAGSDSLAWHVEAQFMGDLTALVVAALRANRPSPDPPTG